MQSYSEAFGEAVKESARINVPELNQNFELTFVEHLDEWWWVPVIPVRPVEVEGERY